MLVTHRADHMQLMLSVLLVFLHWLGIREEWRLQHTMQLPLRRLHSPKVTLHCGRFPEANAWGEMACFTQKVELLPTGHHS
jgi:hypothetical protein